MRQGKEAGERGLSRRGRRQCRRQGKEAGKESGAGSIGRRNGKEAGEGGRSRRQGLGKTVRRKANRLKANASGYECPN